VGYADFCRIVTKVQILIAQFAGLENDGVEQERTETQVYFDATFKVVPTVFYQLFTLFAPFADAALPVVYALMSRKTQALYTGMFTKVQELIPDFSPPASVADFEECIHCSL